MGPKLTIKPSAEMSLKGQALRDLVVERLVVAADEIFALFERTFAEYEEEFVRSKLLQQQRLHKEDGQNPPQQQQPAQEEHPPLDFLFPPSAVKTEEEEADNSAFLQREAATEQGEDAVGAEEPGCSLNPHSDNDEQPYSCSDSDGSDGWVHLAKAATANDEQGEKAMNEFVDEDIPALYKSLFCPELGSKKVKRNDSDLPRPFKCTVCGKAFETDELFEKHAFMHNVQSPPFRCPVCNKPCSNKSSFKKHLNIHTEDRPFRCPVCKKGFNQKCNLKRHMQTHNEEKSFSCPECGLRLKQQHNLLRHISAVHRGEKPYSCPVCDKAFAQKTVYIIHMRTHTGEKPFTCTICKKRFRDKCHLKRHVKTHGEQAAAHIEALDSASAQYDAGNIAKIVDRNLAAIVDMHQSSLFSPDTSAETKASEHTH